MAYVLIFNFLFTEPRLAFKAEDIGTQFTLFVMFAAAFITSSIAARIKEHARIAALAAYRTQVLLETNQLLQKENSAKGLLRLTASQLNKLLKLDTLCYPADGKGPGDPELFSDATPAGARARALPGYGGGTRGRQMGLSQLQARRGLHRPQPRRLLPLLPGALRRDALRPGGHTPL